MHYGKSTEGASVSGTAHILKTKSQNIFAAWNKLFFFHLLPLVHPFMLWKSNSKLLD